MNDAKREPTKKEFKEFVERMGWKIAKARVEDYKAGRQLASCAAMLSEMCDEMNLSYYAAQWSWPVLLKAVRKEVVENLKILVAV